MRGITMIIILLGVILAMMTNGCGGDGNQAIADSLKTADSSPKVGEVGNNQPVIFGEKIPDAEAGNWDDPAPQTREVPPGSLLHEIRRIDYSKLWFTDDWGAAYNSYNGNLIFPFLGGKHVTIQGVKKYSEIVGLSPDNKKVWYTHYEMSNGNNYSSLACDGQGNLSAFANAGGGQLFSFNGREERARRQIGMDYVEFFYLVGAPNKGVWCQNYYLGIEFYNLNLELKKTIYLDEPAYMFDVANINGELIIWNFVNDGDLDIIVEYNIAQGTKKMVVSYDDDYGKFLCLFYLSQVDQLGVAVVNRNVNNSYSTTLHQMTRDGVIVNSIVIDEVGSPQLICQGSGGEIVVANNDPDFQAVVYGF